MMASQQAEKLALKLGCPCLLSTFFCLGVPCLLLACCYNQYPSGLLLLTCYAPVSSRPTAAGGPELGQRALALLVAAARQSPTSMQAACEPRPIEMLSGYIGSSEADLQVLIGAASEIYYYLPSLLPSTCCLLLGKLRPGGFNLSFL